MVGGLRVDDTFVQAAAQGSLHLRPLGSLIGHALVALLGIGGVWWLNR